MLNRVILMGRITQDLEVKQTQNGTAVLLQDLGSLNGTLVNGKPCHETRIVGGETVTLGQTKLVIRTAPTEVSDETMYVRRKF